MSDVPGLVTLTVWGVPPVAVPLAVTRMALDRPHLRSTPGLRFAKLLGTGDGRTFTPRDADPLHWGLLAVWDSPADAEAFTRSRTERAWNRLARERLDVSMLPIASRGTWSGRTPFGDPRPHRPGADTPVAALTRARIRAAKTRTFWRAVPPVSADLNGVDGLATALGIGEAPVGLQGTFSLWRSGTAITEFAHRRAAHQEAVARTAIEDWYAEELFARFEVLAVEGTFRGRAPLDGDPPQP